jgi:hypothetical protein
LVKEAPDLLSFGKEYLPNNTYPVPAQLGAWSSEANRATCALNSSRVQPLRVPQLNANVSGMGWQLRAGGSCPAGNPVNRSHRRG